MFSTDTTTGGLITWYTSAKPIGRVRRCDTYEYGGLTVFCSWCSFDVNCLSKFSFIFHGLSSGNYSKVFQLHEISPILLFNLLFVYSSITVFISIDLVFHTLKKTHPHFSQFWQHSSHVQLLFRSPTVPSTVCSRRSININLIKQSNVLYSVLLTRSYFFCHCIPDLFLFTCFQFCYSWDELKSTELFPQNAFLQPNTQLGCHSCCIWAKKGGGDITEWHFNICEDNEIQQLFKQFEYEYNKRNESQIFLVFTDENTICGKLPGVYS